MSINKKDSQNQTTWSQSKWEQEQIFTQKGHDYGIAYKFRKSSVKLRRKNYLLTTLVFMVVVGVLYLSGNYVSTRLVGSFGGVDVVASIPAINYYAVQAGEYKNIEEATLQSQRVREIGGAGYVYKKDILYKVLVAVYESAEDASSVVAKISPTLDNASVTPLVSPKVTFDYNLTKEDNECLQSVLDLFHDVFSRLYTISVNYDKGEMSFALAQLSMVELQKMFEEKYVPYSSVFSNSRDVRIASLTYKLSIMQDELDKLADPMALQENFSMNIKYSLISICLSRAYI